MTVSDDVELEDESEDDGLVDAPMIVVLLREHSLSRFSHARLVWRGSFR